MHKNHLILLTLQIRHMETCAAAAMKKNLIVILLLALMHSPHLKLQLLVILEYFFIKNHTQTRLRPGHFSAYCAAGGGLWRTAQGLLISCN